MQLLARRAAGAFRRPLSFVRSLWYVVSGSRAGRVPQMPCKPLMHRPRMKMEFYEILDQILALLQRHGRVTYGALKRQFQLDDAYLEDLKAEIIEARQLAVDQDGRVLVWTGGVGTTPEPVPPLLPTAS